METFDYFYRKLSQATVILLYSGLGVFLLTVICAVLGLSRAVATFNGVTIAVALLFAILLSVFLLTSCVRAVIQFLANRTKPML
ncbi:MAG: hypothetical protein H6823_20515 [Planctomycetaceae bacterium]|nr:hypothetical protein [Planctomycetaceae bacterium]